MDHEANKDVFRALSVMPINFFYAFLKCFSGGFVGIDFIFIIKRAVSNV